MESDDMLLTSSLSLFEVKLKLLKDKKEQSLIQKSLEIIKKRSLVIPMDTKIGEKAAEISIALRLSAIDSLIYTTSLTNNATLVTLDNDFRGLKDVLSL